MADCKKILFYLYLYIHGYLFIFIYTWVIQKTNVTVASEICQKQRRMLRIKEKLIVMPGIKRQ